MLSLREVPGHLPRLQGQRKVHTSTVFRWAQRGVAGRKLRTWRLGGRRITTIRALEEFIQPATFDDEHFARHASPRHDREPTEVETALAKEGF
ncbi:MAG: DUF1580 domain-containing protein [Planctomycetes bacterium]|nr:DUF1580 domain-containing protein [Planctomycetota bacterium]